MRKISVITVNLNDSKGLRETIPSVVNQTYPNLEFIIIDGNSKDDSVDVIKEYSEKISRWISEPDNGIYEAMNKGIVMATGDYLMFLNSGDLISHPTTIEQVFGKHEIDEDIVYGNTLFRHRDGSLEKKATPEKLTFAYLIEDDINHQSCFIKRELFEQLGLYDESLKIASDHKFFLNAILIYGASLLYRDVTIATYNLNGLSSKNRELQMQERRRCQQQVISPYIMSLYIEHKNLKATLTNRAISKIETWFVQFKAKLFRKTLEKEV